MVASRIWIVLLGMLLLQTGYAQDHEVPDEIEVHEIDNDGFVVGEQDTDTESFTSRLKTTLTPSIDLYPKPKGPTSFTADFEKTCVALDDEVVALLPLTYRTVPDFYDDPYNAAAIWLGTASLIIDVTVLDVPLWYGYLGYSGYEKFKQEERIRRANLRIGSLRLAKAKKRCFEV